MNPCPVFAIHLAPRFCVAMLLLALSNAPTPAKASDFGKGDLHPVDGGLPWRKVSCFRTLGFQIPYRAFAQSKVIDDPSFEDPKPQDSFFSPPSRPPEPQQISAALQAQAQCALPDSEQLLLSNEMRVNLALYEYEARHTTAQSLTAQPGYSNEDRIRLLRKLGHITPETVFASTCQTETTPEFRAAINKLVPGNAAMLNDVAWVPLLSPNKEILGPGLIFIGEEGGWRYNGITQSLSAQMRRASETIAKIMRDLRAELPVSAEDDESYYARCPMPEAPEPRPTSLAYEPMRQIGLWDNDYTGDNVFGALERLTIRRLAEDKIFVAATTQLLYAEMLVRSLEFDDAPAPGTPKWLERIKKAQALFKVAMRRGVDARRFSSLIGWLGIRYIVGEPGVKQDMVRAQRLLKIAADFGDNDAISVLDSIKLGEIEVCSDHLRLPDRAYVPREEPDPIAALILKPCD